MSALHLTGWDLFAVSIILLSSIMAFARGLLRELFSILAFIGAAAAALYIRPLLSPLVMNFVQPAIMAELLTAGVLFLGVFVIITFATSSLAKTLHKSGEIGALDRGAGLVFGAARGILVLALIVLLLHHVTGPSAPMPDWLTSARTYPVLNGAANGLEAFVPKARDYINEKRKPESAAPPT
jgi:membrane protein required for colicin V production